MKVLGNKKIAYWDWLSVEIRNRLSL